MVNTQQDNGKQADSQYQLVWVEGMSAAERRPTTSRLTALPHTAQSVKQSG